MKRLLAERLQMEGLFDEAGEVVLSAASEESCAARRLEFRAFAGLGFFRADLLDRSEVEFMSVRLELERSVLLRWGLRRVRHYANYFLGAIARTRGDSSRAAAFLYAALESSPRQAVGEIYFQLGQLSHEQGELRRAARWFDQAGKAGYEGELSERWRRASLAAEGGDQG